MDDHIFKKYRRRLVIESAIKAFLCGVIVGFGIDFLISFVIWFAGIPGNFYLIGIVAGAVALVVSAPLFYFLALRPDMENVAKRLDNLGLDARVVTMKELSGENTYIANAQRSDTLAKLSGVSANMLKISIAVAMIVCSVIIAASGSGMTVVAALTASGHLKSGSEIVNPGEEIRYEVVYEVDEGGYIDGDAVQLVLAGQKTSPVIAIPDDGWMFDSWSDGAVMPERFDSEIKEDMVLTAVFVRITESEGEGEGEGDGDGEPSEEPPKQGEEDEGGNSGGGEENDYNNIIDGDTPYDMHMDEYYQKMLERLNGDETLTEEQRRILEAYFNGLK